MTATTSTSTIRTAFLPTSGKGIDFRRMRGRRALGLLIFGSVCGACGDDVSGPSQPDFAELCGENEPIHLLPLDPARKLAPAPPVSQAVIGEQIGDRHVFFLNFSVSGSDNLTREVWSVGPCGEDPMLLAENIDAFFPILRYEKWPDIPFVCHSDKNTILAIDSTGAHPANTVFESQSCVALPTDYGLVTVLGDEDTGPLVLQPWPDDPLTETAEHVVLVDWVKARPFPSPGPIHNFPEVLAVLAVSNAEVLAITTTDDLVAIDLADLSVSTLATGVREFRQGPSGRWIVWQGVDVTNDDPEWPEGPIHVLDRESGESTQIAQTSLAYTGAQAVLLEPLGILYLHLSSNSLNQYFSLPSFESATVLTLLTPWAAIDDERALLQFPFTVVNVASQEVITLYNGDVAVAAWDDDGITVLRSHGGELIRVAYSGESHTLANHAVWHWQFASDGQVFTLLHADANGVGSLISVDPATLAETYVDENVHRSSISLYEADGVTTVSYAVVDPSPDRNGIWLARPKK